MERTQWGPDRRIGRMFLLGALVLGGGLALAVALSACTPSEPVKSREQVWIETHPTHAGDAGECIEFDGELCDEDPFDLDDLYEKEHGTPRPRASVTHVPTKAASPKAKATSKPRPATTRRR